MHFAPLSLLVCLIATAIAQSGSTSNPPTVPSSFMVTAGQPATFTWKPTTPGPVTLTLRSGAASNLNKGTQIATGIDNSGSYTFTLPADTTRNSDYTIEISDDNNPEDVNYTQQFVVESTNTVESITPSASASATAATSASSASAASSEKSSASSKTTASTTSTASAKSASTKSSTTTGSTMSTAAATTTGSSTSSTASSTGAPAPSSNAAMKNALGIQGGVLAILAGLAAIY